MQPEPEEPVNEQETVNERSRMVALLADTAPSFCGWGLGCSGGDSMYSTRRLPLRLPVPATIVLVVVDDSAAATSAAANQLARFCAARFHVNEKRLTNASGDKPFVQSLCALTYCRISFWLRAILVAFGFLPNRKSVGGR
eukprot:COSAG02_NODE_921_length_15917_cov_4.428057_11_plen_140_part_00